jgi:hypothetical protein
MVMIPAGPGPENDCAGEGTDPVSETLCSIVSRIPTDGRSPKTQ